MPRPKPEEESVDLHLKIPSSVKKHMKRQMKKVKAANMTQYIRAALSVYDILITAREDGDELFLRKKDGAEQKIIIT